MTKQEYARKYYQENKERILGACKLRYLENKEAFQAKGRKYYKENSDKASLRSKKHHDQAVILFSQLKAKGCSICGYNVCPTALEFHHLDPSQKEYKLSNVRSPKTILRESAKCIIVCSNCHREIHAGITQPFQPSLAIAI